MGTIVRRDRLSLSKESKECLSEEQLAELLSGAPERGFLARVDAHVADCPACREIVAGLARARSAKTAGAVRPAEPESVADAGAAETARDVEPPRQIGRFVVDRTLGRGGMAVVFAAHDPELDREVAIKLLSRDRGDLATARLVREAQAMARLTHPNVVVVHEVGTFEGQTFVAMELVEGMNLREFLAARRPPWQEIIGLFVQAGRGLAAAHAAGIVHRDFKPANVLVGRDGRARVGDFGLAGAAAPGDAQLRPLGGSGEGDSLTETGGVMGTPAYMAPEQRSGRAVDARSDQYSFCVALFEALYGTRPTAAGLPAPGRDSPVPARLRRVVTRGLAPAPSDRWPSMSALLDELGTDPRAPRRRMALVAGVVALIGAAAVTTYVSSRAEPPCRRSAEKLAGVWDEGAKQALSAAFLATGAPFAAAAWDGARHGLDAYGATFVATHRQICEATHVRNEQSPALLDTRMHCLDVRLASMRALVTILRRADVTAVEHSVEAAQALPAPAGCAAADLSGEAVGRDPAIEKALAELRALRDVGRYREAQSRGAETLGAIGRDRAAAAEAHLLVGDVDRLLGLPSPAEAELSQAVWDGEATGQDGVVADAATELITVVGAKLARAKDAEPWARLARAALDRLGAGDDREASFLIARGSLASEAGHYEEAHLLLTIALALLEKPGANPFKRENAVSELGFVAYEQHRMPEAVLRARQAVALTQAQVGDDHPLTANALGNLGSVLEQMHVVDEAIALKQRDVAIRERLGETAELATSLGNLGSSLESAHRYDEAVAAERRALALREKLFGPDHPDVARALYGLAQTLESLGRLGEARAAAERGERIWIATYGKDHPRAATFAELLGEIAAADRRYPDARAHDERALAIFETGHRAHGIAAMLLALADVDLATGAPDRAVPRLERALAAGSDDEELDARIRFSLARALWSHPRDRARARALATDARAALRKNPTENRQELVDLDAWLARAR